MRANYLFRSKVRKKFVSLAVSIAMAASLLPSMPAVQATDESTTITLMKGEHHFFDGASMDTVTVENPDVVTAEAGTETRKFLFDCERKAINSLEGYSNTPNTTLDINTAQFTVTEDSNRYTIYSEAHNLYLRNNSAYPGSMFTSSANEKATFELMKVEDGSGTSFEIKKPNGRYLFYYYGKQGSPGMQFDGMGSKQSISNIPGDYGFELLEYQNGTVTNLDPIPGYTRTSEITSGNKYLITQYYGDAIIIFYPNNQGNTANDIPKMSKMYQPREVSGVRITATQLGTTTVTVGDTTYTIQVEGDCDHEGTGRRVENMKDPTCDEGDAGCGYTGDTYCSLCDELISSGESIPRLEHEWNAEGTMTTAPTVESDGVMTYTCTRDENHTRTEAILWKDYAKTVSAEYTDGCTSDMGAIQVTPAMVAPNASASFAAEAAEGYLFVGWFATADASGSAVSEDAEYSETITEHTTRYAKFRADNAALASLIQSIGDITSAATYADDYTETSRNALADALTAAQEVAANTDASKEQIDTALAALTEAQNGLVRRLTVAVSYVDGCEAMGTASISVPDGSKVDPGAEVTYRAVPNTRYVFEGWYRDAAGNEKLTEAEAAYTATISENLTLYAKFETQTVDSNFIITVDGQKAASGTYNTVVTLTAPEAPEAPEGQIFAGWYSNGRLVSTANPYIFAISGNADFTTKYVPVESEPEKQQPSANMLNTFLTKNANGSGNVQFVGQIIVPDGYTLQEAGLLWYGKSNLDSLYNPEDSSIYTGVKKVVSPTVSSSGQFSITINNIPATKTVRGVVFVKMIDNETKEAVWRFSEEHKITVN